VALLYVLEKAAQWRPWDVRRSRVDDQWTDTPPYPEIQDVADPLRPGQTVIQMRSTLYNRDGVSNPERIREHGFGPIMPMGSVFYWAGELEIHPETSDFLSSQDGAVAWEFQDPNFGALGQFFLDVTNNGGMKVAVVNRRAQDGVGVIVGEWRIPNVTKAQRMQIIVGCKVSSTPGGSDGWQEFYARPRGSSTWFNPYPGGRLSGLGTSPSDRGVQTLLCNYRDLTDSTMRTWNAQCRFYSTFAEAEAFLGGGTGTTTPPDTATADATGMHVVYANADGSAKVDWTDVPASSDARLNPVGYVVWTAPAADGPWTDIARPTLSEYTFTGLASGSTRYVRAAGLNAAGGFTGNWTDAADVTIPASSGGTGGAGFVAAADAIADRVVDWPMDEASGTTIASRGVSPAMNGTLTGSGAAYRQTGPITDSLGALDLNGTAYVSVADDARLRPASFTFAAPVRVDTVGASGRFVLRKDGCYFLSIEADGSLYGGVWPSGTFVDVQSAASVIAAGNSYLVAVSWDQTTHELALWAGIKGGTMAKVASATYGPAQPVASATNPLLIGSYAGSFIADSRYSHALLYSRALTLAQLESLNDAMSTTAAGSLPTLTTQPSVTGTAKVGQTLTATAPVWSGTGITTARRWEVSDNGVDGWAAISPAQTGLTLLVTSAHIAKFLRFAESATNTAGGPVWAYTDVKGPVAALATPTLNPADPPVISGTPRSGSPLTLDPGSWTGATSTPSDTWQKSANGTTGWTDTAATGSTYTPVDADATSYFRVRERATNADGFTDAFSNVLGPVVVRAAMTALTGVSAQGGAGFARFVWDAPVAAQGVSEIHVRVWPSGGTSPTSPTWSGKGLPLDANATRFYVDLPLAAGSYSASVRPARVE
jgi:hypothetical protein